MKACRFIVFAGLISSYAFSQPYEIKFEIQSASGWFGGDNRPGQRRNVAVGQGVFVENPINLQSFAFRFSSRFDSAANPTGNGHQVSLRLHIRDSLGAVLRTEQIVVPNTYNGGWVTWPNINLNLAGPARYIFTTYLLGGFDSNQVTSSHVCDLNAGYAGGGRYTKYVESDSDAVAWSDWGDHPWDSNFWLIGTLNPTGVHQNYSHPEQFRLEQNYPNPFNPSTRIEFRVASLEFVELAVYDILGRKVATLVSEAKQPGTYEVAWDAAGFSSGVHFYSMRAGVYTSVKKMLLTK